MRDLVEDYLAGDEAVAPFFEAMPPSLASKPPAPAVWNKELLAEIRAYQTLLGGGGTLRGDETAIVTGQQAGLLTGPLYTIYKAATAVRLAQELQARFGSPHVPVFWVHEDDHDFDEVASATLLTKQHTLLPLRYRPEGDVQERPMHGVPVEPSLHALVDEAAHAANGSEYRNEVQAFLHESLDASASFSEWMARIMARLFQGTPLVIFTPALNTARKLAAPVFARELDEPGATTALALEAERTLAALGYVPQVSKRSEECAFFVLMDGRRRKVELRGDAFFLPEIRTTMTKDEMRRMLETEPGRFSANVLLRGVVQQSLLPATAYVAGPGEIAYWAQIRRIFVRHNTHMPIVYPRTRALLTTTKLRKLCAEFSVTQDELLGNPDTLRDRVLRRMTESPEMRYLRDNRAGVEGAADALAQGLASINPMAGQMGAGLSRAITAQLDRMERVLARQDDSERRAIEQRLERLQRSLAPDRKPQERVLNVFSFVFSYGWELVPRLVQELDPHSFAVQEIEL